MYLSAGSGRRELDGHGRSRPRSPRKPAGQSLGRAALLLVVVSLVSGLLPIPAALLPRASAAPGVAFRASVAANGATASASVTVPSTVATGDQLLYFVTANGDTTITTPSGWTLLGTEVDGTPDMRSWVFTRTATSGTAGSTVTATLGTSSFKVARVLVAYSGAAPITSVVSAVAGALTASHATPAISVGAAGSWVVSYWSDKTNGNTGWTLPSAVTSRQGSLGSGSGQVTAAAGDSGPVSVGTWTGATATSSTTTTKAIHWSVVVPSGEPVASTTSSCTGLSCSFNASASTDSNGSISSYAWNFGDSATGTGVSPSHTYAAAGTYSVSLTVTDNDGATGTTSVSVTVAPLNTPPVAAFTSSCTNLVCSFNGSTSTDSDGTVVSYAWTFGDTATASGMTPTHTYPAPGTYSVTLTATDNRGATDGETANVTVTAANVAPTAAFTSTCTGRVCTFDGTTSTDSDGTVTAYAWVFGDGTTGTGATASHTYTAGGTYNATLTVTDDHAAQSNVGHTVPVSSVVYRAGASATGTTANASITVPAAVQTGDQLVLFVTANGDTTITTPSGWTLLGSDVDGTPDMHSWVFTRTATAGTPGSTVTPVLGVSTFKVSRILVAYSGAGPITVSASAVAGASTSSHATPTVTVARDGAYVINYWSDKTNGNTGWSLPVSVTSRQTSIGSGSGQITAAGGDAAIVAAGTWPGATASSSTATTKAIHWSVVVPTGDPLASFTTTCTGLACNLNGGASGDTNGTIASYAWNYGDATTGTGATATHTYSAPGTYTVTLTVTDNDGATSTTSTAITVTAPNTPPTAAFSASCTNLDCAFNGAASSDSDGTIASYAWNFGDSTTATTTAPSHTYSAGGTYTITLTVTDNGGAVNTVTHSVTILPANSLPTASFTSSCSHLVCSFNSAGSSDSDGTIVSYAWNFGDSTTSTSTNPTHTYSTAGTRTVTLTVTDDRAGTSTKTASVTTTPANVAPIAAFTVSCSARTCTLDASASSDSDGSIASYVWSFGDGATATGRTVAHTFAADGAYTVNLTVADNDSTTDTLTKQLLVPGQLSSGSSVLSGLSSGNVSVIWSPSGSWRLVRDGGVLWRSSDGVSWSQIVLPSAVASAWVTAQTYGPSSALAVIADDGVVRAFSNTATYRFEGGQWFGPVSGMPGTPYWVVAVGSTLVMQRADGYLWSSVDGGVTWAYSTSVGLATPTVLGDYVHLLSDQVYLRFSIATRGFVGSPAIVPIGSSVIGSVGGSTSSLLLSGVSLAGGFWARQSADGGATWTVLIADAPMPYRSGVSFGASPGLVRVLADGLVHVYGKAIESGVQVVYQAAWNPSSLSWGSVSRTVTSLTSGTLMMFASQRPDGTLRPATLWMLTGSGSPVTYTATDVSSGAVADSPPTWPGQLSSGSSVLSGLSSGNVSVIWSPSGSWRLVRDGGVLWRSSDGVSWSQIVLPSAVASGWVTADGKGPASALAVIADDGVVRAFAAGAAYRFDGGQWFGPVFGVPGTPYWVVAVGSTLVMQDIGTYVSSSSDGGVTWMGTSVPALPFLAPTVIGEYVHLLSDQVYLRFSIATRGFVGSPAIVPSGTSIIGSSVNATIWMVVGGAGMSLYRSTDNGATWTLADSESFVRNMTSTLVSNSADDTLRFYSVANCSAANLVYGASYSLGTGGPVSSPVPLLLDESSTARLAPLPIGADRVYPGGTSAMFTLQSADGGYDLVNLTAAAVSPETVFGFDGYGLTTRNVNAAIGSFVKSWTDLKLAGVGPSLELTRTYNSADPRVGIFGRGWTSTFETRAYENCITKDVTVLYGDGRRETHYSDGAGGYVTPGGYTTKLVKTGTTGWTLTDLDGTVRTFRSDGRMTSVADADGQALNLTWNGSNKLTTVTDAITGRSLTFTYTGNLVTSVSTNPVTAAGTTAPLVWNYSYSGSNLAKACEPRNNNPATGWCTTYLVANGKITTVTDPNGHVDTKVGYAGGKVAWSENGKGERTTFTYIASSQTIVTDPLGRTTSSQFDDHYRVIRTIDARGGLTQYHYNAAGFRDEVTDQNGSTTTKTFDAKGNVLSEANALGQTTWYGYDAYNNRTSVRDARSSSATDNTYLTTTTWDGVRHNKLSETTPPTVQHPSGTTTSWTFTSGSEAAIGGGSTPARLMKTSVDANGGVTSYRYDSVGNLREVTDASGLVTAYGYDELGRRTSATSYPTGYPAGVTTSFALDALGNVIVQDDPGATNAVTGLVHRKRTATTIDPVGNTTQVVESDIGQSSAPDQSRTTTYTYDAADRIVTITDPAGGVSVREYDAAGQVVETTDARGQHVQYAFNEQGLETSRTAIDAVTDEGQSEARDVVISTATFDAAGRQLTSTDSRGIITALAYDAANRVTTRTLLGFHELDGSTRDIVVEATTYDAAGHPTVVISGGGARTEQRTYDAAGVLTQVVVDPAGLNRTTSYTYDANGNVLRSVVTDDTRSEETRATYDAGDRVLTSTIENGAIDLTTTYTYDNRGNKLAQTSPAGNVAGGVPSAHRTQYEIDQLGRTTRVTSPAVTIVEAGVTTPGAHPDQVTGYDTYGEITHQTDEHGNVTRQTFDRLGRVTEVTYPSYTPSSGPTLTPIESFVYDSNGNLASHVDRRGATTDYVYDGLNRPIEQLDPVAGASGRGLTRTFYDGDGNIIATIDPAGARTEYTHDDAGRPRTDTTVVRNGTANPFRYSTGYDYDDLGNLVYERTPLGNVYQASYNAESEQITLTDPAAAVTTFGHDIAGRITSTTDPLGRRTITTFDLAGRPTAEQHWDHTGVLLTTTTVEYDADGNVISSTSPRGNLPGATASNFTTTYTYDALERLLSVTQPVSGSTSIVTSYGYDAAGNQTSQTDGRGNTTLYGYNTWNLPTSLIEPSTSAYPTLADRTWTTDYDPAGLEVQTVAPGGVAVSSTYDALGRLIAQTGSGTGTTTASRTYSYDRAGHRTSIGSPAGTIALAWDDRGLLTSISGPAQYQSSFSYDADGRTTSRTDATGVTTYTWTNRADLASITDPLTGGTRTHTFDPAGQLTSVSYGSGNRTLIYDDLGRLINDHLSDSALTPTGGYSYAYDADSNVTGQTADLPGNSQAGSNVYGYDYANRLTSWTKPNSSTAIYAWDAAGNLTNNAGVPASFNERNQLVASGLSTHTWTPRGTTASIITSGTPTTFTYDGLDRLTSNGTNAFTYDDLDRIATTATGTVAYAGLEADPISIDGVQIARSPSGTAIAAKNASAPAVFLGRTQHGDIGYQHDAAGAVNATTVFDPFGKTTASTGATLPIGYQGDYTDPATGNTWMGARWYQPDTGTFASRDTVHGQLGTPVALNRYTYAWSNPLGMWDPDGHNACNNVSADQTDAYINFLIEGGGLGACAAANADTVITDVALGTLTFAGTAASSTAGGLLCGGAAFIATGNPIIAGAAGGACGGAASRAWNAAANGGGWDDMANAAWQPIEIIKDAAMGAASAGVSKWMGGFDPAASTTQRIIAGSTSAAVGGAVYDGIGTAFDGGSPSDIAKAMLNPQRRFSDAMIGGVAAGMESAFSKSPAAEEPDVNPGVLEDPVTTRPTSFADAEDGFAPACHSFSPGTLVVLADGSLQPIDKIEVGDHVLTTDPTTGAETTRTVTELHRNHDQDLADVTVRDSDGHVSTVHTTQLHRFWDDSRNTWVTASHLTPGDQLHVSGAADTVEVVDVQSFTGLQWMYDLTVDQIHTYYVVAGDDPVLVHNCNLPGATNTVGALDEASSAAFRAADNIGDFSVSAKHLPGFGGNWNRFGAGVDPNDAIAQALRSPSAQFFPNGEGTFKVVTNLGYQVGEKASQTGVRVIVTTDGRIITAFPVKP